MDRRYFLMAVSLLATAGCKRSATKRVDSLDDIARICALVISCEVGAGKIADANALKDCARFHRVVFSIDRYRAEALSNADVSDVPGRCAISSTDCASYFLCITKGMPMTYCAGQRSVACVGEQMVMCESSPIDLNFVLPVPITCPAEFPCVGEDGGGSCRRTGACVNDRSYECDGSWVVYCQDDLKYPQTNCAEIGGTCATLGKSGIGYCVPNAESQCPLDAGARSFCETDTSFVECQPWGDIFDDATYNLRNETDCARWDDGVCKTVNGIAQCVPDRNDCNADTDLPRCNGDAVEICLSGSWRKAPCADIGVKTCRSDPGPKNGVPLVRCVP